MNTRRADLVWAALVIVRLWLSQGKPKASQKVQRLGGFECWAEVIGGILEAAEYEDFLSNLQEFYTASDVEGATWRSFVQGWWDKHQDAEVGVSDLYALAEDLDLGKGNEKSQKTKLGSLLRACPGPPIWRISDCQDKNPSWRTTIPADESINLMNLMNVLQAPYARKGIFKYRRGGNGS